jgi:hypothetical protein
MIASLSGLITQYILGTTLPLRVTGSRTGVKSREAGRVGVINIKAPDKK